MITPLATSTGFVFDWGWDWNWLWLTNPTWNTGALLIIINALAVYRVARFIARDSLTENMRSKVVSKYHGSLVDLMLCVWCLSVYGAVLAMLLTSWQTTHDLWLVIAGTLSIAAIAGLVSERA